MKRLFRMAGSLILAGAIAAPIAMQAQDHDRDDKDRDRDRNRNNNARIYDREHRDYHTWNNDEDGRYRQWYTNTYNGREYRDYNRLHKKDQQQYWNWRHSHGDNDHDRDDRH
jgi:hypothetical protein